MFGGKVRYFLKYGHASWTIFTPDNYEAILSNKDRVKGPWNVQIVDKGGMNLVYATVHRALHRVYEGNILDVPRPGALKNIRVFCSDSYSTDGYAGLFSSFNIVFVEFKARIDIWKKLRYLENDNYVIYTRTTDEIFSSTIHELGHAIHYRELGGNGPGGSHSSIMPIKSLKRVGPLLFKI